MKIHSYIHRHPATWTLHQCDVTRTDLIRGATWLCNVMKSDSSVFDVPEGVVEYAIHELAHAFTLGLLPSFTESFSQPTFNLRKYVNQLSQKISQHIIWLPSPAAVVNEALTWAYEIQVLKRIRLLNGRPFYVADCFAQAEGVGADPFLVRAMRKQLTPDEMVARHIMTILVHAANKRGKHAQR